MTSSTAAAAWPCVTQSQATIGTDMDKVPSSSTAKLMEPWPMMRLMSGTLSPQACTVSQE